MQQGARQGCHAAPTAGKPALASPFKRFRQHAHVHHVAQAAAAAPAAAAAAPATLASEYEALQKWLIEDKQLPVQFMELAETQDDHFGPQPVCTAVQDVGVGEVRTLCALCVHNICTSCPAAQRMPACL